LNFIKATSPYFFRRHFRQGLRSHIMEILQHKDVALENQGTLTDGVRSFPRARPTYMLRIFRTRLPSLEAAMAEIARVNAVSCYLGAEFAAGSNEFVVDYHGPQGPCILLCGLQAYVSGEVLDPWSLLGAERLLPNLYDSLHGTDPQVRGHRRTWLASARRKADRFVRAVKAMITEKHQIPDLAGTGNLLVTAGGGIKLVDINNISPVVFGEAIPLDDKGYPVCDKSIEALALIEEKLLGRAIDPQEPIYRFFLAPERLWGVTRAEEQFQSTRS
jgi:hypothetical protein